jgi:hypothetical protein
MRGGEIDLRQEAGKSVLIFFGVGGGFLWGRWGLFFQSFRTFLPLDERRRIVPVSLECDKFANARNFDGNVVSRI